MDALDGSQAMLDKAKEKDIYQKHVCAMMGPAPLPLQDGMCLLIQLGFYFINAVIVIFYRAISKIVLKGSVEHASFYLIFHSFLIDLF